MITKIIPFHFKEGSKKITSGFLGNFRYDVIKVINYSKIKFSSNIVVLTVETGSFFFWKKCDFYLEMTARVDIMGVLKGFFTLPRPEVCLIRVN